MNDAIITTSLRQEDKAGEHAKLLAHDYKIPYFRRKKRSIAKIFAQNQDIQYIFSVDHLNRLSLTKRGYNSIKFHPGLSLIRIKRIIQSGRQADSFIQLLDIQDDSTILDATIGQASDAIVAQFVARNGQVVGLEKDPYLALLTKHGLANYKFVYDESSKSEAKLNFELIEQIEATMRKIIVFNVDHKDYLLEADGESFDYIYFDPMFRRGVDSSTSMQIFSNYTIDDRLDKSVINEGRRVAKKMIVLKERSYSPEFPRLSFNEITRKNSSTSFGIINLP